MQILSEDTFYFREARIVDSDKGAGVVVIGGLRGPGDMRKRAWYL